MNITTQNNYTLLHSSYLFECNKFSISLAMVKINSLSSSSSSSSSSLFYSCRDNRGVFGSLLTSIVLGPLFLGLDTEVSFSSPPELNSSTPNFRSIRRSQQGKFYLKASISKTSLCVPSMRSHASHMESSFSQPWFRLLTKRCMSSSVGFRSSQCFVDIVTRNTAR